jgi:hypothetical protein
MEQPAAGIQEITGAVLWILTTGDVKLALLPATSVALTVPETAEPSVDSTRLAGSPDLSRLLEMLTLVLFQPLHSPPEPPPEK